MSALISSIEIFENLQIQSNKKYILYFWSSGHEISNPTGPLSSVIEGLSSKYNEIQFYTIEAELFPMIASQFAVTVTPTFVSRIGNEDVGRSEGVNPGGLSKLVRALDAHQGSGLSVCAFCIFYVTIFYVNAGRRSIKGTSTCSCELSPSDALHERNPRSC